MLQKELLPFSRYFVRRIIKHIDILMRKNEFPLMNDQKSILCGFCGLFKNTEKIAGAKQIMSESWEKSYSKYQIRPPELSVYN